MSWCKRHLRPALLLAALLAAALPGCELIDEWYGTDDDFADDSPAPAGGDKAAPAADTTGPVATAGPAASPGPAPAGPMQGFWRFTDDEGVIHYVDSIRKVPKRYRKRAVHPEGGSYTIVPATPVDDLMDKYHVDAKEYAAKGPAKTADRGQVILYSTSWCPYCKKAASHLRSRGVAFIEKDIGRSRADMQEMLSKSGGARGVPVLDVHGTIIRGYNPSAIDAALGR